MMEVFDCPQRSDEWYELHKGLPTASEFHKVMAKVGPRGGTTHKEYVGRTNYMRQLAGELITGEMRESYSNRHMERGREREEEARWLYAMLKDVEPEEVGFIRNGNCGCSPDSLIEADGLLEIKDAIPAVQIARLEDAKLPPEHKWQVHGEILVSEREWCDFMSHSRGLPPLIVRVHRDEEMLAELRGGINRFVDELYMLVERIRRMW